MMLSLTEIEAAVDALPASEQQKLFRHLSDRLKQPVDRPDRRDDLPLVPASGRPITQEELDDARDAE